MPNLSIDGGLYSFTETHLVDSSGNVGNVPDLPTMDAYMVDQRDRWKFVLENQNTGQDWEVGRVFRWEGATDFYAYGFLVKRLDGSGGSTDDEFLVVYAGPFLGSNGSRAAPTDVFSANADDYFRILGGFGAQGFIGYHYNYAATLDSYDIGVGVDLDPPNTNPHTDTSGFFPDPVTQGVPFLHGSLRSDYFRTQSSVISDWKHCWVVNWEEPFVAFYSNFLASAQVRIGAVVGDILIPEDSADLRGEAGIQYETAMDRTWSTSDQLLGGWAISQKWGDSRLFSTFHVHDLFTPLNQPRVDGRFDRDRVKISNTNEHKGYFKEDVIAITGTAARGTTGFGGDHNATFDCAHGLLIKVCPEMSMPWADGQAPPFNDWPKYTFRQDKTAVESVETILSLEPTHFWLFDRVAYAGTQLLFADDAGTTPLITPGRVGRAVDLIGGVAATTPEGGTNRPNFNGTRLVFVSAESRYLKMTTTIGNTSGDLSWASRHQIDDDNQRMFADDAMYIGTVFAGNLAMSTGSAVNYAAASLQGVEHRVIGNDLGATAELFLNGVSAATADSGTTENSDWAFGRTSGASASRYLDGTISAVVVFDKVLSGADVITLDRALNGLSGGPT